MGFLSETGNSIYLALKETIQTGRPLAKKPQSVWTHQIPEVFTMDDRLPGTKLILRPYGTAPCIATARNKSACWHCNNTDPLWHQLAPDQQVATGGKYKGQRVDFSKKVVHLLPMYNHTEGKTQILKSGNQVFKEMEKWDEAGNDIRGCDWDLWKKGTFRNTENFSTRKDSTQTLPLDLAAYEEEAKAILRQALDDLKPLSAEEYAKHAHGVSKEEAIEAAKKKAASATTAAPAMGLPAAPSSSGALPPAPAMGSMPALPPPPPPPVAAVDNRLMQPLKFSDDKHYVLLATNQWKLVAEAKREGYVGLP